MATTDSPIEQATEMARQAQEEMPAVRSEYAPAAQESLIFLENIPAPVWIMFSMGSILASMALYFSGRKWAAIFVGLWPPTIVNLGLFARLLKPSRE